jgi:small subunit ribosomal protein S20
MASHKSAIKQNRKDVRRRAANRAHRSTLRSSVKRARTAIGSGKIAGAAETAVLKGALATLDRKASKGIIHRNAAGRVKSRLMKQAAKAAASSRG